MAKQKTVRVIRTEYYEDKIGKWVAIYEGTDEVEAKAYLKTPIIGRPMMRVAEHNKIGVRKIRREYIRTIG